MNTVYIRGLRASAIIGVYERERHVRQTLVEMIVDEAVQAGFRSRCFASAGHHPRVVRFKTAHETVKDVILDEVEQLVLGRNIIIEPCDTDARPVGHQSDGSGIVAHLGKDRCRRAEDFDQLAIVFRGVLAAGFGPRRLA